MVSGVYAGIFYVYSMKTYITHWGHVDHPQTNKSRLWRIRHPTSQKIPLRPTFLSVMFAFTSRSRQHFWVPFLWPHQYAHGSMFDIRERDMARTRRDAFLAINWRLPFRSYGFKVHVSGNRKSGTESELPSNNKNKPHKDVQTWRPPNLVLLAFMWKILFWGLLACSVHLPWKYMSIQISSGLFTFHANRFLGYGGSLGCLLLRKHLMLRVSLEISTVLQ